MNLGRRAVLAVTLLELGRSLAAQNASRILRVAILDQWMTREPSTPPRRTIAELERLGFREGRNIAYEWRHPAGDVPGLPRVAADMVASGPDAILAFGTISARAAWQATSTIPIVAWTDDPARHGLADATLLPVRNVTGFVDQGGERTLKLLETLKSLVPGFSRFGLLLPADGPTGAEVVAGIEPLAARLGVAVTIERFRERTDIERGFSRFKAAGISLALAFPAPALMPLEEVVETAMRHGVALVAEGGGARYGMLLTFSPEVPALRLATQLAKVLRGVPVAQIPFERPEKFVMHVSRKTAKALGIDIPQGIYLQADHVYDDWQDDREPAAKK